jgi:hypothetical protein
MTLLCNLCPNPFRSIITHNEDMEKGMESKIVYLALRNKALKVLQHIWESHFEKYELERKHRKYSFSNLYKYSTIQITRHFTKIFANKNKQATDSIFSLSEVISYFGGQNRNIIR